MNGIDSYSQFQEIANKSLQNEIVRLKIENERAKQIIRDFNSIIIDYVQEGDKDYSFIEEARQFIKETEK